MTHNLEDLIRAAYSQELLEGAESEIASGQTPDCLWIPDIAEWRRFGFTDEQELHLASGCGYCEMTIQAVFGEACPDFQAMFALSSRIGGSLLAAHETHIARCEKCFEAAIGSGEFVPSVYSLASSVDRRFRLPGIETVRAFMQRLGIDLEAFPWVRRVVALMKEYPAARWPLAMSRDDPAAMGLFPQAEFAEVTRSGRARRAGSGRLIADSLSDGLSATLTPEADVMWSVEWTASKANAGRKVRARLIFSDGSEYPEAIVAKLTDHGTAQVSIPLDFGAARVVSFVVQFVA